MKKKILKLVAFAFGVVLISSCETVNESKDLGEKFYKVLQAEKYDEITPMLHPEGLAATPAEQWKALLTNRATAYGKLKSFSNSSFKANTNNGVTITKLKYKVEFEKSTLYELLTFKSETGKVPLILGYEYNENESEIDKSKDAN